MFQIFMQQQSPYNEEELRLQLAEGDEIAFARIVHHYFPRLHPFVMKLTKTKHTADEIVQETFLRLWEKRKDFQRIEKLNAWLFRVASNLSITSLRRAATEGRLLQMIARGSDQIKSDVDEFIDFRESSKQLKEAVEQLPDQQKIVFKLRMDEGLNNHEIAERLNISPFTVKNHLAKAMQTLREIMGKASPLVISFFIAMNS